MFSRQGLFDSVPCPDRLECRRPQCLFSHNPNAKQTAVPHIPISAPSTSSAPPPSPQAGPSRTPSQSVVVPTKRPNALTATPSLSTSSVRSGTSTPSRIEPARKLQRLDNSVAKATSSVLTNASGVPILRVSAAVSQVPIPVRQTMLKTLYDHFSELYTNIIKINPSLPAEHALAQEEEVYNQSTKLTYRNAVIQSVSALKKRPKPSSINHDSVGTEGMIKAKQDKAQRLRSLQLSRKHLQPYIMSLDEMKKWGYIVEIPDGPGGAEPSLVGKTKQCERCNQHYLVKSGSEASRTECKFHWGRPYTARINAEKVRLYKCCSQDPSISEGCDVGPHVFSESDPVLLHARHAFSHTRPSKETDVETALDVVALDCEMIYSAGGVRVARVSVVDGTGKEIFDEVVKMDDGVDVIDFNTRFSGVNEESYSQAVMTLSSVRRALDEFISSETIIVGHALENDLKTLRMIHHNCVDTAVLFPHRAGPPYRRALRELAREHLDRAIQTGGSTVGHSSVEDSIATLDLVRVFVLNKATLASASGASQS